MVSPSMMWRVAIHEHHIAVIAAYQAKALKRNEHADSKVGRGDWQSPFFLPFPRQNKFEPILWLGKPCTKISKAALQEQAAGFRKL